MIILPGPAAGPAADVAVPSAGPATRGQLRCAVLLDRDGTLIEDVPSYVRGPSDIRMLPGVAAAAATFRTLGVRLGIVSNQAAIGRGLLTREQVLSLHRQVVDQLDRLGLPIGVSILCPHAPDDGCPCRKPQPGMLVTAARQLGVPVERTFVVGDAARDIEAARAAGMRPLLVLTGHGPTARQALAQAGTEVEACADLAAAADRIAELCPLPS